MPITPERISRLREFGLSEYAARAYLALLDLGLTEARDVSNLSRVPQAKVYQVLDQLHDKGLAIILPEFPKKYAPVPFEEFLERIQKQHREAADSIQRMRGELTQLFSVVGNVDVGDRGDFTIVRGRRNVVEKLSEMVDGAQSDFLLIGTQGLRAKPRQLVELARRARERGVATRCLLPLDPAGLDDLTRLAELAQLRARDPGAGRASDNVAIAIVDGARALLIHFVPDDGDLSDGRDVAVFTDQEAMVGALQVMAVPLWEHAPTWQALRDEPEESDDSARVYTSQAEAAAALHASIARGVRTLLALHPVAGSAPLEAEGDLARALRQQESTVRIIAAPADTPGALPAARVDVDAPTWHVRVDDEPRLSSCVVVDEREAFVSIAPRTPRGAGGDLVLHTTNRAAVRALILQFDEVWTRARLAGPARPVPVRGETDAHRDATQGADAPRERAR